MSRHKAISTGEPGLRGGEYTLIVTKEHTLDQRVFHDPVKSLSDATKRNMSPMINVRGLTHNKHSFELPTTPATLRAWGESRQCLLQNQFAC